MNIPSPKAVVELHLEGNQYLIEQYCMGNTPKSKTYKCPLGCSNGACTKLQVKSCKDSDGGKNYYVAGSVTYETSSGTGKAFDFCSGDYLIENYCSGNKINSTRHYCSYGCSNGACKKAPVESCKDSDGGRNYYAAGSVSYTGSNGVVSLSKDYCSGNYLTEYYCSGNKVSSTRHYCSYGCSNGACKNGTQASCRDSDGGKNYYAAGYVDYTGSNGVVSFSKDYCSGNYLTEYYCSGNKVSSTRHYCSYGCSNGACKNETQTICHAGDWKCDSNWPKYAYACVDNQWINIGEVPPAPPNGAWVCDKTTGKLTIQKFIPIKSVEERAYCNYNNNPWRCKLSDWPGKAYFCVNHKWMKIDIPPAPPQSRYVCQNNEVKIVS